MTAKKNVKKQSTQRYIYGIYAAVLVVWAYILGSLAIDNGSFVFYAFAAVSVYWAYRFAKMFVRNS